MDNKELSFDVKVDLILSEIGNMLKEKNAKYGNSALAPLRVFSKADPIEQLKVRMDDKLSRIYSGTQDNEDTIADLMGYLVIYKIASRDRATKLGENNGENNKFNIKNTVNNSVNTAIKLVNGVFKREEN